VLAIESTMIDSSRDVVMADRIDALSTAIKKLSREVSEGLAQQEKYTGEAYIKLDAKIAGLDSKMDAGFGRIVQKLDQFIDAQVHTNQLVDRRLRLVEERLG
jgi:hypothetical protein